MYYRAISPAFLLSVAMGLCLITLMAVGWFVVATPWMGLHIGTDASRNQVLIHTVAPSGPMAAQITETPLHLLAVQSAETGRITLEPDDVVEDPDMLESYEAINRFRQRQSLLHTALIQPDAELVTRDQTGQENLYRIETAPYRSLTSLSSGFWVQILVGVGTWLIGVWVWSLRRKDPTTILYAATGISVSLAALSASVYSVRELAMDGDMLRLLSHINHLGASGFGVSMIALFALYPSRLLSNRVIGVIGGIFAVWLVANYLQWWPSPMLGQPVANICQMALIIGCIIVQWLRNRRDPRALAILRWLGLFVVIGAGMFVMTILLPTAFQIPVVFEQGHAFFFFLLIYIGVALGVTRYRLFELGEWSFRILFYTIAAFILLAVDIALVYLLHLTPMSAFWLAMLLVLFGYIPLRDVLWRRFVVRDTMRQNDVLHEMVDVAFGWNDAIRSRLWHGLLERQFIPLEMTPAEAPVETPSIEEEGVALLLPAIAGSSALKLRYPWGGRGLFGPRQLQQVRMMVSLMRHAEQSREAYERGVSEERQRIAQDLHDDIASHLVSGLHKASLEDTHGIIRQAMADIRTIVAGLTGKRAPLSQLLADMRHEAGRRLEAANIALIWHQNAVTQDMPLDYNHYKNLISAHREIVTNILRHSQASAVTVTAESDTDKFCLNFMDNGIGLQNQPASGNGLNNIRKRMQAIGAAVEFIPVAKGLHIRMVIPAAS